MHFYDNRKRTVSRCMDTWPIIDSSSLYSPRVTRGQGAVLRQIGRPGHFQSRDKDGGQTIRSAISKTPAIYLIYYATNAATYITNNIYNPLIC